MSHNVQASEDILEYRHQRSDPRPSSLGLSVDSQPVAENCPQVEANGGNHWQCKDAAHFRDLRASSS